MYVAYLNREAREVSFDDHDTFVAYLQRWEDEGYEIQWLDAKVAAIGGKR